MAKTGGEGAKAFQPATRAFGKTAGLALLESVADGVSVGLVVLDAGQNVHWANHGFEILTGFRPAESAGRPGTSFIDGQDVEAVELCLKTARDARRSPACPVLIRQRDGAGVTLRLEASSFTDDAGQLFFVMTLTPPNPSSPDSDHSSPLVPHSDFIHDVITHSSDGFVVVDLKGEIVFCNTAAARLFDRHELDMIGTKFGFPFSDGSEWTSLDATVNGKPVYIDMQARPVSWRGQDATLATLRNVTERHEVEAVVAMQMSAMEAAANGIFITDVDGHFKWANAALGQMSGYDPDTLVGQPASVLKSGQQGAEFFKEMWTKVLSGKTWRGQVVNRHADGHLYTVEQSVTPIHDAFGRLSQFVAIQDDISEKLKAQAELVHMAKFDTLTDLPNRELFVDRVTAALERAARSKRRVAVMVMDLDDFKDVNNTLGHDVGDQLLVTITQRIKDLMRTTDTLSRLGGDEFGLLLEDLENMNAADRLIRAITRIFDHSIDVGGRPIQASASIGIAVYPDDDANPLNLMRHAELAMYRAKSESWHSFQYFDQAMDDEIRKRVKLETDLRTALVNDELWLAYQPQIDLQTGKIIGAEALLRWNHPELGFVSPGEFIPVAEACGLILPIGDWIIEEICRQLEAWRAAGLPAVQVGINVSGNCVLSPYFAVSQHSVEVS